MDQSHPHGWLSPPDTEQTPDLTGAALRAAFDEAGPHTVGIEDEVLLLDPDTYELVTRAQEVMSLMPVGDQAKFELPASQLELVTEPAETVAEAGRRLLHARSELARKTGSVLALASAGMHPFSAGRGELNVLERHAPTVREYGPVLERQLVCAFQVHVAPGSADRALAVYNSARSYLPLLAALAANAPFYEGRDSGLASVRPKVCELLPRQGIPPALASWDDFAQILRWGTASGSFAPGAWWWELRPHRSHGTLEFRVPDGQSSPADGMAVAGVVQALVAWLGARHDSGERLEVFPSWVIGENRWSACRYGVEGEMADLSSGARRPTRGRLRDLLDELEPVAQDLGSAPFLARARELIECNGAIAQRQLASRRGMAALGPWLCERFLAPLPG